MSRRRFLTLAGAGAATVAGSVALYGVQRLTASAAPAASAVARPARQRVVVETRYTPVGVPYQVAVALD